MAILAVNSNGVIIRANPQARRTLSRCGIRPEGLDLSACVTTLMRDEMISTRLVVPTAQGEETLMLVLSDAEAAQPLPRQTAKVAPELELPPPTLEEPELGRVSSISDFIAHELRNPLNTILGISEILESRFSSMPAGESLAAIGTMRSEAERALVIIKSLLLLAERRQQESGSSGRVPLHAVIRRVTAAHSRIYPERAFVVSGDSPLFARGDASWAELALRNLVANAEKYTPKDQPIEIELRQNGSWATAMVLDRGQALNPEVYRSLWEIYTRGAEPEVLVTGSGIGLFLCKKLVREMGGHVWAGRRETSGSAFAISLPVNFDMSVPEPSATPILEEAA